MEPYISDWMQTYSGKRFYPKCPQLNVIDPVDIAHALSMLCRYGGHVDRFYSVAEHCVLMSRWVDPENALAALLHDATEAYVVDVPRPLKKYLSEYKSLEDGVWQLVTRQFNTDYALPEQVREADDRILLTERNTLMPRAERWLIDDIYEPLPVTINGWLPQEAESQYLERLMELTK